jgi:hypothetical protein
MAGHPEVDPKRRSRELRDTLPRTDFWITCQIAPLRVVKWTKRCCTGGKCRKKTMPLSLFQCVRVRYTDHHQPRGVCNRLSKSTLVMAFWESTNFEHRR